MMAVGFLLAGVALPLATRGHGHRRAEVVAGAGSVVFTIGSVALFGYAANVPAAYRWGHIGSVSCVSAASLEVIGAGLVTTAWSLARPPARWTLTPMTAGVAAFAMAAWAVGAGVTGPPPRGAQAAALALAAVLMALVICGLVWATPRSSER